MKDNAMTRRATRSVMTMSLVACFWLFALVRAEAVGVAYCSLEHHKAGDETVSRTTAKYALIVAKSRSDAKLAAYKEVNDTLQTTFAHLIGKSAYDHGEGVDNPRCDTWAFSSGFWTLIETEFTDSLYTYHTIAAGVGTTREAAAADAVENLRLRNWSWSVDDHPYQEKHAAQELPSEASIDAPRDLVVE